IQRTPGALLVEVGPEQAEEGVAAMVAPRHRGGKEGEDRRSLGLGRDVVEYAPRFVAEVERSEYVEVNHTRFIRQRRQPIPQTSRKRNEPETGCASRRGSMSNERSKILLRRRRCNSPAIEDRLHVMVKNSMPGPARPGRHLLRDARWYKRLQARLLSTEYAPYTFAVDRRKAELFGGLEGDVVEIGPGGGVNLRYFGPGVRWIGVEPNPYLHDVIRARARELGRSAEVRLGRAE